MNPQQILSAVRRALASERNPHHLVGLASSLGRSHAVSASLLFARARLLDLRAAAVREPLLAADRTEAASVAALVTDRTRGAWNGQTAVNQVRTPLLGGAVSLAGAVERWSGGSWRDAVQGCLTLADALPEGSFWHPTHLLEAIRAGASAFPSDQVHGRELVLPDPERSELGQLGFQELYTLTAGPTVGARASDLIHAAHDVVRFIASRATRDALVFMRAVDADGFDVDDLLDRLGALVTGGALSERSPRSIASPAEVQKLAEALVVPIAPDVRIVDPVAFALVCGSVEPHPHEGGEDLARWVSFYGGTG